MRKHLSIFILILFLLPGVFSLAKTSSSSDIRYLFAYFTDFYLKESVKQRNCTICTMQI